MAYSERVDLIIKPLAKKVMDLTLGRFQVLEHHRHKIPEFITLCTSEIETLLLAISQMDFEKVTREAKLARAVETKRHELEAGGGGIAAKIGAYSEAVAKSAALSFGNTDEEVEERHNQLDKEEEDARLKSMTADERIEELVIKCQRLKASELFLRSTLSDILRDLETKQVLLDTQSGKLVHRQMQLTEQREAFLRENRQLRDIVQQWREKGRCDLPDPILYNWHQDITMGTNNSSAGEQQKGTAASDGMTELRKQFEAEKEAMQSSFAKQLDESKFRVRTMEAQLANVARAKIELQHLNERLTSRVEELESQLQQNLNPQPQSTLESGGEQLTTGPRVIEVGGSPIPIDSELKHAVTPRMVVSTGSPIPSLTAIHAECQTDPIQLEQVVVVEKDPVLVGALSARHAAPDGLGDGVHKSEGSGSHLTTALSMKKTASTLAAKSKSMKKTLSSISPRSREQPRTPREAPDGLEGGPGGTSPWNEGLEPAKRTNASMLESAASTPSQLERVKEREAQQQALPKPMARAEIAISDALASSTYSPAGSPTATLRELQQLRSENASLREALEAQQQEQVPLDGAKADPNSAKNGPGTTVMGQSSPSRQSANVKLLKDELHKKSLLLEERSLELEQLRLETMRWFEAYKRSIPNGNEQVTVNYETAGRLKAAVVRAEAAEEQYRLLSWVLIRKGIEFSLCLDSQMRDCKQAEKDRDISLLSKLQRHLDVLQNHIQLYMARIRQQRAAWRVDANKKWDRVLFLARGVCSLEDVEGRTPRATPRYYSADQTSTAMHVQAVDAVNAVDCDGRPVPTTVYFRAVSSAAATFTTRQQSAVSQVPIHNPVGGANCATLLPQRPQSAHSVAIHAAGLPGKLRAAVNRPTSAIMLSKASAPVEESVRRDLFQQRPTSAKPFNPSLLRCMTPSERRSTVMSQVVKDKADATRDKKALAEERYHLRASACTTVDTREYSTSLHTTKLVGRCETL